jgi:uncharacterized protein YjbJ (UPF0337 family)
VESDVEHGRGDKLFPKLAGAQTVSHPRTKIQTQGSPQACQFCGGTPSGRTSAACSNSARIAISHAAGVAVGIYRTPTNLKEMNMNWDRIEGNWKQFKGNVKEQWGKLTDDQLDVIAGKRDSLAGKIQETYGITKEESEKQLEAWQKSMKDHIN